jgi:methylmalonyl-CoA/ethylmalonyl-CoA epimerase
MIKKINHIAIVVPELTAAIDFWVAKLGLALDHVEDVPSQAVEVAFLPVDGTAIELLRPTDETSGVARFMQKRGAGIHHICFEVDDIVATLDQLRAEGVPLIDETATVGSDGRKYAFVHPKGTGGVLVELYELAA